MHPGLQETGSSGNRCSRVTRWTARPSGEDSIEVALTQDKVHVDKQVVGVEKVSLATSTVTEQQQVTDAVGK